MKKTLIAGAGVAALGFAAMPVLSVFAGTSTVTDIVKVTLPSSCTLASTGSDPSAPANTTNEYAVNMTNGELKSDIGSGSTSAGAAGANVLDVNCNDPNSNGWQLTAVGASDGASATSMNPSGTGTAIATGIATNGATSNWAMKVTGASGITIDNGFSSFRAVPATGEEVARGTGTVASAFTMLYQVYISPSQATDTYTGKVLYTLTNPAP